MAVELNERRRAKEIDAVASRLVCSEKTGRPYNNEQNLEIIFTEDPLYEQALRLNEFTGDVEWRTPRGLGATDLAPWAPLADHHLTEIRLSIGHAYEFVPSVAKVNELLRYCARLRAHHPVRTWLESLVWDGTKRITGLLPTYVGAENSIINTEIGRRFMISAVARIMKPGCKVDTTLILVGGQGAGKSTFFRVLAGDDFFSDTPIDIGRKDAYIALRGAWLFEMAELAAMRPREAESVKAFLSSPIDRFRPPYMRCTVDQPRQCVFVGTTNEQGFLKDSTGARRFWPVEVGEIDVARVAEDRAQLWAEAVEAYDNGERWWMKAAMEHLLTAAHEEYEAEDPWHEPISEWLSSQIGEVSISDVLSKALEMDTGKQTRTHEIRAGAVLRRLKYTRKRVRRNGARRYIYLKDD